MHRHNTIMETPEARARTKSAKLHKKLTEKRNLKKNSAHSKGEEEEEELDYGDKNEDLSPGEEGKNHVRSEHVLRYMFTFHS